MNKKSMTKVAWSIADARQILDSGSYKKVDGMLLDHFSASALVQIFDALSPENQAKLEAMALDKAMDIVWKLAAKHGSVHVANYDLKCDDCDHVADNSSFGRPKTCPKCGSTNVSTRQDGWSPRPKGMDGNPIYGSVRTAHYRGEIRQSVRTAGKPGDETFDEYEKDDWSPQDGEPKYPELAEDDDDLFYDDFAHEASVSPFAIIDPTDTRPLHSRVAAAFLKKG